MSDFRYRVLPSPIGQILVVVASADGGDRSGSGSGSGDGGGSGGGSGSSGGIVLLYPFDGPVAYEVERASVILSGRLFPDDLIASDAAEQLAQYFDGRREAFDLILDWRLVRGFTKEALRAICEIPFGETASYGEVAIMAGTPRAARAVGTACAITPFSLVVPVHRVIRADGSIGEYGGHPEVKRFLLDLEKSVARQRSRAREGSAGHEVADV